MRSNELEKASDLYTDFTGHHAPTVHIIPAPHLKKDVRGLIFGALDFLFVIRKSDKKEFMLNFRGNMQPKIATRDDGKQLYIVGDNVDFNALIKTKLDNSIIKSIGYKTKRDGKQESYVHEFLPSSRPVLRITANSLKISGGSYQFLDTGINDR